MLDWVWVIAIVAGGLLLVLSLYLAARGGRERPLAADHPGKPPLRSYAGILQTDANPVPIFVIVFSIGILLWAGIYVLWIGAAGLWY